MPDFQVRDDSAGLAIYAAMNALDALKAYAADRVLAANRLGLSIDVGTIDSNDAGSATVVIDGVTHTAMRV